MTAGASSGALAYARIRRAIVRLELAPGSALSEVRLMDSMGLTKAAVRAALARLRADGLVESVPRKGHFVSQVTLEDVREIYDLRLALEPAGARVAASAMPADEARRLRRLPREKLVLEDPDSVDAFFAANRAIHVGVSEAAGNRRSTEIVARLLDDCERAQLVALRAGAGGRGATRTRREHVAVLDAIAAGEANTAEAVMREAIAAFAAELIAALDAVDMSAVAS